MVRLAGRHFFFFIATTRHIMQEKRENENEKREGDMPCSSLGEKFYNLTPHSIQFLWHDIKTDEYKEIESIPPQGTFIRLIPRDADPMAHVVVLDLLDSGPVESKKIPVFSPPSFEGFSPDPHDFLFDHGSRGLIVSSILAENWKKNGFKWKGGVFSPNSGPGSCVRYPRGHEREGEIRGIQSLFCWIRPRSQFYPARDFFFMPGEPKCL